MIALCDDELAFMESIRLDPRERTGQLAYADWLREHDRHHEANVWAGELTLGQVKALVESPHTIDLPSDSLYFQMEWTVQVGVPPLARTVLRIRSAGMRHAFQNFGVRAHFDSPEGSPVAFTVYSRLEDGKEVPTWERGRVSLATAFLADGQEWNVDETLLLLPHGAMTVVAHCRNPALLGFRISTVSLPE